MEITLSPELQEFIERKVQAGSFASADAVIAGALQVLKEEDELPADSIEYLRPEINIGMEQSRRGESTALDMDAIRQKVRERTDSAPR
jgi:putative addiction module CopG family antidote